MVDIEPMWDIKELASRLRVNVSTIYSWVQLGYIPHVRLGNCVRFRPTDIAAWVNGHVRPGRMTREPTLGDAQHDVCAVGAGYE